MSPLLRRCITVAAMALSSAWGCYDFDLALAECRQGHRCEDSSRAPTLLSSFPERGTKDVPVDARLALVFDDPMDRESLQVTVDPAYDPGLPDWSGNDTRVTFPAPPSPFVHGLTYAVTVTGADIGGAALTGDTTFTFTVRAPADTTPPTVVATLPSDGATGIPVDATMIVTFSKSMREDLSPGLVTVTPMVPCLLAWEEGGTRLRCTPDGQLEELTAYTVTLSSGLQDGSGNGLSGAFSFSFVTGLAPDTTSPQVVATLPSQAAIGVGRQTPIRVTFSEPMNKLSAQEAFEVIAPGGVSGQFGWNAEGTELTFTPSAPWPYGAEVQFELLEGAQGALDLAGNGLTHRYLGGFRVLRISEPFTLTSSAALDGTVTVNLTGQGTPTPSAETSSIYISVGDTWNNLTILGFLSFDLTQLPGSVSEIIDARLVLRHAVTEWNPNAIGKLTLDSISYGATLQASAWTSPRHAEPCTLPCTPTSLTWLLAFPSSPDQDVQQDVSAAVRLDLAKSQERGGRSQFRIFIEPPSTGLPYNANGFSDVVRFDSANASDPGTRKPKLVIRYPTP